MQWFIVFFFSWSSGKAFIYGAGGLRFNTRAGQIGHSVANGSPTLQHFFAGLPERSDGAGLPGRSDAEMGPANSFHTSASIISIMKGSIWFSFIEFF